MLDSLSGLPLMKTLIVGISVRAMVESAVHSGYAVFGLDAFADRDLKALAESYSLHHDFHVRYSPKALYEASRQLIFDAVAYTSNLENHPEIISHFARDHKILGNSPQAIASVRHWETLFARLRRAGFSVPETIFAGENKVVDDDRRWLIKPVLSGGGHGIAFFKGDQLPGEQFMLQEYIPGKPCAASFVANGRESAIIGITEQLIGLRQFGSQGFRYCGNLLPLPEMLNSGAGRSILEQVRRLAEFLTLEYGLSGVNGMDFILNGDQVCLTEVNPRYSASMELIEQAYGLPVFHLHAQAVLEGKLPEFKPETMFRDEKFFGKSILFAERDAIAPDTQNWPARAMRDIPASGEELPNGGPICTILASRPTHDETFAELIRQAGIIKQEIHCSEGQVAGRATPDVVREMEPCEG
jgi:predicted ATP-grasp superfamily ATP-dependent carboligase